jgi:hypothetical protein
MGPPTVTVGALASVTVNALRQIADPTHPRDKAWEKPRTNQRWLEPLNEGDIVYVIDSQSVDGVLWWKVADSARVDCCAPFGWITATGDASRTTVPVEPNCPDAGIPMTGMRMGQLDRLVALVCFGSTPLSVTGNLSCDDTHGDAAVEVASPWPNGVSQLPNCQIDATRVVGDVLRTLIGTESRVDMHATLTGHFDDPRSSECEWIHGSLHGGVFDILPPEGGPADTAAFDCRTQFVVTEVVPS